MDKVTPAIFTIILLYEYLPKIVIMRLWSLHPKYLDAKGLVALWREALLAKHVLEGRTKGYIHHPQLIRFKKHRTPVLAINSYLYEVHHASLIRGYHFDQSKIGEWSEEIIIPVTRGQLAYEKVHLENKLKVRDQMAYVRLKDTKSLAHFSIFKVVPGEVECWEIR